MEGAIYIPRWLPGWLPGSRKQAMATSANTSDGTRKVIRQTFIRSDTLVGTDSHTTMVNGLGVLGWGVGGIEAEAVLLGQPIYLLTPEVIGVRLTGALPQGATATDLVLTVTQLLRKRGVVGKFVEFTGAGLSSITVADRASIPWPSSARMESAKPPPSR